MGQQQMNMGRGQGIYPGMAGAPINMGAPMGMPGGVQGVQGGFQGGMPMGGAMGMN